MKPAALEIKKAHEIELLEAKADALLKAKGIPFDHETPPVRKPEFRVLQALERINAKLALVMEANKIDGAAVPSTSEPAANPTPDLDAADAEQEPVEAPVVEPKSKPDKAKKK